MSETEKGQPAVAGLTLIKNVPAFDTNTTGSETDPTTAQRFETFHEANPRVYETLVQLARAWVRRTRRDKLGIASLYERTRWELALQTNDPDYKLNNDFKAYYARLIMAQEPDLNGLFQLRRSAADTWLGDRAA